MANDWTSHFRLNFLLLLSLARLYGVRRIALPDDFVHQLGLVSLEVWVEEILALIVA